MLCLQMFKQCGVGILLQGFSGVFWQPRLFAYVWVVLKVLLPAERCDQGRKAVFHLNDAGYGKRHPNVWNRTTDNSDLWFDMHSLLGWIQDYFYRQ